MVAGLGSSNVRARPPHRDAPAVASPVAHPRAAFRFLLPRARSTAGGLLVDGGDHGVRAALAEIGIDDGETAPHAVPGAAPTTCATIVWLADASTSLGSVADRLAPGGIALLEVDRHRRGRRLLSPGRLARRARALGLVPIASYLQRDDASGTRWFVPLDHAEAARWALGQRSTPTVGAIAVSACVARIGLGRLAWLADRHLLVAQRPRVSDRDDGAETPVVPAALELVPGARWHLGTRCVVRVDDDPARGHTRLLPFEPDARRPASEMEVIVGAGHGRRAYRELDRLHRWQELDSLPARRALPLPLGWARVGGVDLIVRSAPRGRSLRQRTISPGAWAARQVRDLEAVSDWLVAFETATRRGTIDWTEAIGRQLLVEPLEVHARQFGSPPLERLALELWSLTLGLDRVELPFVERHGVLLPQHVHVSGRSVWVSGWTSPPAEPLRDRLPLVDLLDLVIAWHALARKARSADDELRWLHHLLAPAPGPDRRHEAAWRVVRRACTLLGVDRRLVPALLALSRIERLEQEADRPSGRRYVAQLEVLTTVLERTTPATRPWS
jgi:hypothetical protein